MSNLGLQLAMRDAGIRLLTPRSATGTCWRSCAPAGLALGGEQSGHVVMPTRATTGDGVLTALQLMARMAGTGASLAELAAVVQRLPQVLINVPVARPGQGRDRAGACWPRWTRPRPSSATTAGCCCARPAPSSWSG